VSFDSSEGKHQDLWRTFFDDNPTIAALAILSKFQNNIRINENRTIVFCYNKIDHIDGYGLDEFYSPFVVISSSHVKGGEEIEITSGVGGFSKAALAEIVIDRRNVSLDPVGAAHYKFKASDKPGTHRVPVKISFTDREGKKQTITNNIGYTVANQVDINN
jgi:hypothetical protein